MERWSAEKELGALSPRSNKKGGGNFIITWTPEQLEKLKAEYIGRPVSETATLVGHSPIATRVMACRLGIKRNGYKPHKRPPLPKADVPRETTWSRKNLIRLQSLYYRLDDEDIARFFETSVTEIRRVASERGFYKGPAGRSGTPMAQTGTVYLMRARGTDYYKVGFTSLSVATRLSSMNTHSPLIVDLVGTIEGSIDDEQAFHKRLKQHNAHGEWFLMPLTDAEALVAEFTREARSAA